MGGYRISELAERTGFPASTLRFYEQEGLLPAAARTPGGYRSYDERSVERLKFIARAKQLDLPLDEIRELAAVWDGGSCAPVQERLVALLDAKITYADARFAELRAFRTQLVAARDGLGRHTPDGPCDDECGCVSEAVRSVSGSGTVQPVQLLAARPLTLLPIELSAAAGGEPVACSLTGSDQQTRVQEWNQLLASVTGRENTDGGIRLTLPADADLIGQVARLAALEQQCCRFFDFTIDLSAEMAVLTVRAPAHAADLLDTLFGQPR
jgi:DNA-binding transcriptional MerR regulator